MVSGVGLLGCVLCVSVSAGSQAMLAPYLSPFTSTSYRDGDVGQWEDERRDEEMVVNEL